MLVIVSPPTGEGYGEHIPPLLTLDFPLDTRLHQYNVIDPPARLRLAAVYTPIKNSRFWSLIVIVHLRTLF